MDNFSASLNSNDLGVTDVTWRDCQYYTIVTNNEDQEENAFKYTVMHLNIRSLPNKMDKLKLLLTELQDSTLFPDIVLLCETWLGETGNDVCTLPDLNINKKAYKESPLTSSQMTLSAFQMSNSRSLKIIS